MLNKLPPGIFTGEYLRIFSVLVIYIYFLFYCVPTGNIIISDCTVLGAYCVLTVDRYYLPSTQLRLFHTYEHFSRRTCYSHTVSSTVEAIFGMIELLYRGQGKKDFMRFKKTVTKALVASDSITSIATSWRISWDSFKSMLDKFNIEVFKDCGTRHQLNYLYQNLHKPGGGGDRQGVCREAPGDQ